MPRFFLEVAYKGTAYSGFQSQQNANSIQTEVENAFSVLQKEKVGFTGSSRTDAGVHALQNYFHFDYAGAIHSQFVYKINAILPADIVVKSLKKVSDSSHCRFDALSRQYSYYIYDKKNPFLADRAFYYPYKLDFDKLQEAAQIVKEHNDFTSFSKRNTQAKTFICEIQKSKWYLTDNSLFYNVKANRFLRGMVRGLTATMLLVGRHKLSIEGFKEIIGAKDCTKASFSVPPHGLFLISVEYPEMILY
ncbi:MAG: tRNA pseudouridine(38-40) synthase TruA [Sphingobacteriales bacterium]|nr:tRNA pseudouridine(38-40) synthase TruA [Sphingobacteriales bacterium]